MDILYPTRTKLKYWFSVLCLLLPALAFADQPTILIIKTGDNHFFNTTIEQLIDSTGEAAQFAVSELQSQQKDEGSVAEFQLIVTLGYEAARYVSTLDTDIPAIYSYLTRFQRSNLEPRPTHHSILLEQPLARYVRFIKSLLALNSIGIVRPAHDPLDEESLAGIRQQLESRIDQAILKKGDNAVNAVRHLLANNDVLLALPAPEVYNRQSLKGILLASYRLGKPVISYSPSHVKSGALAAIFTTPEQIGRQLSQLVTRMLKDPDFRPPRYSYASEFDIAINHNVARSLDLELPDRARLMAQITRDSDQ